MKYSPLRRVHAAEGDVADAALGAGHHAVRQRGRQRAEEQVAELHGDLPAGGDGGRVLGVDDGAGAALDVDQPVEAVVHRDVGIDQALEHVDDARVGLRRGGVGGRLALLVAAGEIDGQAAGLDRDRGGQLHRLVGDAVAVHEHLGAERAVGELGEGRARAPLRVAQQLLEILRQRGRPVLGHQRRNALNAEAVGRGLGAEVAGDLARAAEVGADHREDVRVDLAALDEAHAGDDEAFLVDLAGDADAAGRAAADIDVMRDVGHVAEQRAVVEDRRDERDVVEVHAALVGIVDEDAVAGLQALRAVGADGARHQVGQRAQVGGLSEGLGDGAQLAIEERAREIAARLDVGRVGGAAERGAHLLGDGEQPVADDLEADRIDLGGQGARGWSGRWGHGPHHKPARGAGARSVHDRHRRRGDETEECASAGVLERHRERSPGPRSGRRRSRGSRCP